MTPRAWWIPTAQVTAPALLHQTATQIVTAIALAQVRLIAQAITLITIIAPAPVLTQTTTFKAVRLLITITTLTLVQ